MIRQELRRSWLIILCYVLAAFYVAAPIHSALSSHFLGADNGDVYEIARQVWWFKTALLNGDDVFSHSLLDYPEGSPAVRLWAQPLQMFPAWLFAFFVPLATAYNLTVLLTLALNGWSMYLLARRTLSTSNRFPAFIAGLVFLSFPTILGQLLDGHLGLLVQWPAPLFIICLFAYADHGGKRRFFAAALLFMAGALGYTMQVFYVLTPLAMLFVLARLRHRDHLGALRAIAVALAGAHSCCCISRLFWGITRLTCSPSMGRAACARASAFSAFCRPPAAIRFGDRIWRPVLGGDIGGSASYVGALGGLLALLGIIYRPAARWWLLVALVAWLLALGPLLKWQDQVLSGSIAGYEAVVPLPYALLVNLPLSELARSPARFMLLFAPAFSLLAGFGAIECCGSRFAQRRGRRMQIAAACVFAVLLLEDYRLFSAFPACRRTFRARSTI